MNCWHDVELNPKTPETVTAVIEVPKDSKVKYEMDKATGMIRVDRILFSSVHYPANYGFLPRTYCDDQDPLDVLVLGQLAVVPLSIMEARPIGMMKMRDQGQTDDKIIAIHVHDPEYSHYRSITELPAHRLAELKRFFQDYKALERREVIVDEFLDEQAARRAVEDACVLYDRSFGQKR